MSLDREEADVGDVGDWEVLEEGRMRGGQYRISRRAALPLLQKLTPASLWLFALRLRQQVR